MKPNVYTLEQAERLIAFYKPKLIGKTLEESTDYRITDVSLQTANNLEYRVIAVSLVGPNRYKKDVSQITLRHNLPSPEEVLSGQSQ